MRFIEVPLTDAEGAILAHSMALVDGRLRKGVILTGEALDRLRSNGIDRVTVAILEAGDLHEDDAAEQLACAVAGVGLNRSKATTGRVNLSAQTAGIVSVDASRIGWLNAIDPMLTIATVPPWQRVEAGQIVATIKIISYGVAGDRVAAAVAAGDGALSMRPPVLREASLIETSLGSKSLSTKGRDAIAARLTRMDGRLAETCVVPHQTAALSEALRYARGEVVLILTASATSDLFDVAPQALRQAGGTVERFGMPVDPGNLLFIGTLEGKPVIGLPGCARSLALNGADWVLERVLCGVPITSDDIAGMGVGGLLKDIATRPLPRHRIDRK